MNPINTLKKIFTRNAKPEPVQEPKNTLTNSNTSYGSGSKFPGGKSRKNPINIHDHFSLRQQARDAMYDSTVAKSLVDRYADTVVDTGLKLKPTPAYDIIGLDAETAEIWAEKTAERFHLWAKSKKSHRSRTNTFYQNQRLAEVFQQRDNDYFVRFYYSKDRSLINPLQIEFIDPNQIKGMSYTNTFMQYHEDDGIIKDDSGVEVGYKIWQYNRTSGKYESKVIPSRGARSGRTMMIHGFNPEYAGQTRGMSRLTHVLQEFEEITDLSQSVIQKAINQSSYVFAVENDQQDPGNFLEGRVAGPVKEYGSYPQPPANAQNVTAESTEPIPNYSAMPEATNTVPGSVGVLNMRKGDKLKYLQDTSPSESYDNFVTSFVSYLAASNGMPIEVLLMKFGQNYSASRGALILFWRVAQIWREELASDFLNPVYESWLSEEIAAGRIECPGWSNPQIREAWLCAEWAGSPMPNIDPLKTATSDQLYAEMGAQTLDDVARNFNGSSGKANRIKNQRQFEEIPDTPFFKQTVNISKQEEITEGEE